VEFWHQIWRSRAELLAAEKDTLPFGLGFEIAIFLAGHLDLIVKRETKVHRTASLSRCYL
jgi:hypothetical protein